MWILNLCMCAMLDGGQGKWRKEVWKYGGRLGWHQCIESRFHALSIHLQTGKGSYYKHFLGFIYFFGPLIWRMWCGIGMSWQSAEMPNVPATADFLLALQRWQPFGSEWKIILNPWIYFRNILEVWAISRRQTHVYKCIHSNYIFEKKKL